MASVNEEFKYDVFISFRGEDTRYGFTGHLRKALDDKGVRTFVDDDELPKGDEITPSLFKAIEDSQIAIVVLSKNYASSSFCLQELSKILDTMKDKGRSVLPVFYKVDPSDVRKLKRSYGEAMDKHDETSGYKMNHKWKRSLHQVANLSGFHYKKRDGYEHEFIRKIVEQVLRNIKPVTLPVEDCLVGLEPQKQHVMSLLNVGYDNRVQMIGIHGIGGIGKTTLALAVYNLIAHQFEGSCFVENVREISEKHGLPYVQKIILSKVVGEKIELTGVLQGISIIQQRLRQKKLLVVLDDVNQPEQLQAIVGRHEWFGPASRVIVTTRDKRLLTCHGVESTYEVKELSKNDAFEFLRRKVLKTEEVSLGYVDVLKRAITYASGLPLALEVIGSHLFNKTIEQCNFALDRYERRIPDKKIQTILRTSFDALNEEEKNVFLDIACCFKEWKLAKVEKILHAHHGHSKKDHINVLVEKSLIKISESDNVTLHDLIENMGKEIVRQESPEEPGKRSRLWLPEDILHVLEGNTGTSKIEIIYVHSRIEVEWNGEAFKKMRNLKTLILGHSHFSESPKHLPNSIRVLKWRKYPALDLPYDFHPKKLAICKLASSDFSSFVLRDLFMKKLENLKVLNLNYSRFLTQIPDISGLQNLEKVSFQCCENLISIDASVGLLDKLKILNASNCQKLTCFPPLNLASLEQLGVSYCESLENFPPIVGGLLEKLKILKVKNCKNIRSIPTLKLVSLEELEISYCNSLESFSPLVDELLGNLKFLSIRYCPKLKCVPPLKLPLLEQLYLLYCDSLESFPHVVDGLLEKLKIMRIVHCKNIKSIPPLMLTSLEKLEFSYCDKLENFSPVVDRFLGKLKFMIVRYCRKLKSIPSLELASLEQLDLSYCDSLENFPLLADGLLHNLKIFGVINCINIRSIPCINLAWLEELDLSYCDSLESFPSVVDGMLDNLKILKVHNCSKLTSFPPLRLASLEKLSLSHCSSLKYFPPVVDGFLCKLKFLSVRYCRALQSFPPLKVPCLEKLNISHCFSLEMFPPVVDGFLDNLQILKVRHCRNLRSFPPLKLASLVILEIIDCHSLKSFPAVVGRFLGELKILNVSHCSKLRSFPPLKVPYLEKLNISHCYSLERFPPVVDGFLNNLQILKVHHCCKLRSFPPLKLASLVIFEIIYCHSLKSFPPVVDGFLGELKILNVSHCSKLRSFPPLKLASLVELEITYCHSLQNFPPVVDGLLGALKILNVSYCSKLRNFPPLNLVSLSKLDLLHCYSLERFPPVVDGLMEKLSFLNVQGCIKLRSFPPLKLTHLQEFVLSHCYSFESFPEILGKMEFIKQLHLEKTPIKELPFSFQNLTQLQSLYLSDCGIVKLPSCITKMSQLGKLTITGGGWLFPKQDEIEEILSPIQSSKVEFLCLSNCILSEESLAIGLKWFSNVKELYLNWSNFTILPECIKQCNLLRKLNVDNCEKLQEIKGIPRSLKIFSAFNCISLYPSCTSKLLNQELHESGNTSFRLPHAEIPNWLDHQCMQRSSISFWFRNKFPAVILCIVSPLTQENSRPLAKVIINGVNKCTYMDDDDDDDDEDEHKQWKTTYLHIFHMLMKTFDGDLNKELLKNKWYHAMIDFGHGGGIHVLKEKSIMKDIRFTNPENHDVNLEHTP